MTGDQNVSQTCRQGRDSVNYGNECSKGIVSDVIRGMRSGSVKVFHALTTGSTCIGSLQDGQSTDGNDFPGPNPDPENAVPLVAGTVRVRAPRYVEQVQASDCDDEAEVMESLRSAGDEAFDDSLSGPPSEVANFDDGIESRKEGLEGLAHSLRTDRVPGSAKDLTISEIDISGDSKDFAAMLARNSTKPLEYGGVAGPIDDALDDKMCIDRLFLPVREDGMFKEGVRKKNGAKHVFLHPRDMLSHAYLQTASDGVLHVLPGWDHEAFICDIAYRYRPVHSFVGPVPFLGGDICTIRKYRCVGVLVCHDSQTQFRYSRHCEVDPEDENIIGNLCDLDANQIERKKVISIFNSMKEREDRKKGVICGVAISDPSNLFTVVACKGKAMLVPRRAVGSITAEAGKDKINPQLQSHNQRRCDYFIGCTGYHEDHDRVNIRHYARTIDIDNDFVPFLRRFMSGEEQVSRSSGDCNFVQDKNKGKRKYPRHGLRLLEVPCKLGRNDKKGNHEMTTFEPVDQEHLSVESKILYVSCKGEHLHPPPQPPEATVRKLQILEDIQSETRITCSGELRKEFQRRFMEAKRSGHDGSRFDGNLSLTTSAVTKVLKRIQPPISKLASEVGGLAVLAADTEMPFVRDSKMVDGGYVFFLMMHASTAISFAGDATFRTVSEANRSKKDSRWYLYNIVVHGSGERANGAGIVVMRALMTGLSTGFYYAIWRYFLDSIAKDKNLRNGGQNFDLACIRVPYLETNRAIKDRSCLVASITMDFDVAEIHGCAKALQALTGGTAPVHIENAFI